MKIALVYSFDDSDWFSCRVILKNLIKAYLKAFGEKKIIHINYSQKTIVEADELTFPGDVSKVVFLDHEPHPRIFIRKLQKTMSEEAFANLEFIFHVFGDFPLYLSHWNKVLKVLEGKKIKLICASEKQKDLIQKFIKQEDITFVSPFPVNSQEFYFDEQARSELRTELKIKEEKVFIYVGRLSYEKRIFEMIKEFFLAIKNGNLEADSVLVLVGSFDSLRSIYLGSDGLLGEYFSTIDEYLSSHKLRNQVKLIGRVKHSELNKYYAASDCFYSLSTYHDEDYGMAVAEALCSGLPLLITNWAGYSSFKLESAPDRCSHIPVSLGNQLTSIDTDTLQICFKEKELSLISRGESEILAKKKFSIAATSLSLQRIISSEIPYFAGTSDFMSLLANQSEVKGYELFKKDSERIFNKFYYEAYDVYAR